MSAGPEIAVWFPAVRTGTGTDVFTERLAAGLARRGIRTEITWLPLRAEYAPWTVAKPQPPEWATIAHVNTWLPSRLLPKHLPIVGTIHHSMHHPDVRPYKGLARALYHRFWIAPNERRVLQRAESVVAVSRFVAETAKRTLLDVPMQVVYNGVDTERFRPGGRQWRTGEPFRLLYVGAWKKLKGVDLLAPVMRTLGDGFELRYTGGTAVGHDKHGMPSNMHDIGRLQGADAVIAAMQDVDALLFPSRSEGFPLVVVEAMACGLPVIATCGSSLAEAVETDMTGLLCEQDSVAAFAKACRQLERVDKLQVHMQASARAHSLTRFSLEKMIEAYSSVYDSVMTSSNHRSNGTGAIKVSVAEIGSCQL